MSSKTYKPELLIRFSEYKLAVNDLTTNEKPDWFETDQLIALSVIYKNMTQTHIFPVSLGMFHHMRPQYQRLFVKALAYQMKYINENQSLYDNPSQYLASHTLGTSSTGPITQSTLEELMNVLAPKARYYLEQMGWMYTSLSDRYPVEQFYMDLPEDDEYATVGVVKEYSQADREYSDALQAETEKWVEDEWLQSQTGYGEDKYLKVIKNGEKLEFKWENVAQPILDNFYTKAETDAKLGGKIDLLGDEAYSHGPYHFPYHMTLAADADKVKATAYTITLDNTKHTETFDFVLPSATNTSAGLMTAADKVKLDGITPGSMGKVDDVKVDGTSVVTDKIANINLTGKLDKIVSSTNDKVYVAMRDGTQDSIVVTTNDTGNAVVRRLSNSNIVVPETPTADNHAVSKKYADGKQSKITYSATAPTDPKENDIWFKI